jgi:hypothetical protein
MVVQQLTQISGIVGFLVVVALIVSRKRLGVLKTASWLVIWGAVVLFGEHPQFALTYTGPPLWPEAQQLVLISHARLHFFMAGIYTIIGLLLLGVIARTLLIEGRRAGWYSVLVAVVIGGGFDLVMGRLWFQHGSPLYFMGEHVLGFGWEFLYVYLIAWMAALVISYKPIFSRPQHPECAKRISKGALRSTDIRY